jgi:hypothetical protein
MPSSPTVLAAPEFVGPGATIQLANMFSYTPAIGSSVVGFDVEQTTSNGGYLIFNGTTEATGTLFGGQTTATAIPISELSEWSFVAGPANSSADQISFTAVQQDGGYNSPAATASVQVLGGPPIVAGEITQGAPGIAIPLSSLFTYSPDGLDPIVSFEVEQTTNQGGHLLNNGTVEPVGTLLNAGTITNISQWSYVPGAVGSTDSISFTAVAQDGEENSPAAQASISSQVSPLNSQILFQNAGGQAALWQFNAGTLQAGAAVGGNPGPSWQVVGSGSFFTGDTSDFLWQNTSGQVAVWKVQGTSFLSGGLVGGNPGTSWHVRGTGNFYGDGNTSILWQNDNGAVALWDVNGTSVVQSGVVASNPGPSWHIEGTGDFYSDGGTDVLWQNDSGAVALWELNGTTIAHSTLVANPGPSWHIVGTGDFVGNGDTDILWQNSNGAVAYWDMHDGTIQAGAVISNPGPSWHVVGTGDFNSDGKTDIVFQNDSGAVAVWEMNAGTIQAGAVISNPGTSWSVVGSDQMRFIYSTGANDTLTATPTTPDEFVLANPVAGLHTISGFNPVQDMIELNGGMFASFAAVQAATVNTSGGALINLGNGASLLVAGISASSLQARDFSLT